MSRLSLIVAAIAMFAAACGSDSRPDESTTPADLSAGATVYAVSCSTCHGQDATGTDQGPPLIDEVYRPSHHSDAAFEVAIRLGAPQHHWDFGPMQPLPNLSAQDITDVTAYVRDLQRRAGID